MKGHLKKYGAVGLTCFAVYLAIRYWQNIEGLAAGLMSAAWPLVIGCAAAYVVNILMSFYENKLLRGVKKGRRAIAAALSYISLVLMIVLLFNLVLPELWACLQLLGQRLPDMMEKRCCTTFVFACSAAESSRSSDPTAPANRHFSKRSSPSFPPSAEAFFSTGRTCASKAGQISPAAWQS